MTLILNVGFQPTPGERKLTLFQGQFYINLGSYYSINRQEFSVAMDYFHSAISLAVSSGSAKWHTVALDCLARNHYKLGNYLPVRLYAREAYRLARISGY
jgi:hypothetical protein